ncbi:MAG: hypothetical protein HOB01_12695 [Gammaproteobacteria bacterium]|jgi:hypothetical protein|nr:hypothetical protein [Gammaproteobacteria bacterium]MBT6666193.1 hypothetical protein [Gammaproteobacteria bacterium]MBT7531164.1 hypothetical protein [Gammaproteobacteria bacterium]HIE89332.1 hypothetical protein [Gammaproteobacteria bacterium]
MMFPWYDSHWHFAYEEVCAFLRKEYPAHIDEFVDTLSPLRTRIDFKPIVVPDILDQAVLSEAKAAVADIGVGEWEVHEIKGFGRLVFHDHPYFCDLQQRLAATVSDMVGEEVFSYYNFLSIYNDRGVCEPHLDTPGAKWTLDITLDVSASWPIHISPVLDWPAKEEFDEDWEDYVKARFPFEAYEIDSGSGLIFSGSSQWHYRNPAPSDPSFYRHLVFFHYAPTAMKELVDPESWTEYFGIQEIEKIVAACQE